MLSASGWGGYFRGRLYRYKRFGRIAEYADTRYLYLDFDHAMGTSRLRSVYTLARLCGFKIRWVRCDRTAHGWHMVVAIQNRLPALALVAAQAILGSDFRRESLNLMRCLSRPSAVRARYWNILFDKKI
jgi:hypothetical protein